MDSENRKKILSGMMWIGFSIVVILAGCQITMPKHGWSVRKWGPLVPHTKFPGDCSICHLPERWDKLRDDFAFDHEAETGYALEGAHSQAVCLRCHNDRGPVQTYVARGCAGCHQDPHALSLGMDCESCHEQLSWEPIGLVAEHARTRFPLMGVHTIATCESCHEAAAAGQYRGAPTQCEICHQDQLAQATDPNHLSNGWISGCQRCHQPNAWQGAFISHDFFPLSGGHALDCSQCHVVPGTFTGLSQDCYTCHSSEFQSAPGHVANNYSHDCTQCHGISDWDSATFDHSFFPLTGAHGLLDCLQCHAGGVYTGLSQDCSACHSTDYQAAPNHVAGSYPLSCDQCHATTAWTPAAFDHSFFALTGGHSGLDCTHCHAGGVYTGLSPDCYACHTSDYQGAPDHASLSFPHDCVQCHSTAAWTPANFTHDFPLVGNHNVSCVQCHNTGTTQTFTCLLCHEHSQTRMDDKHSEVNGYSYNSQACYNCHPNGTH